MFAALRKWTYREPVLMWTAYWSIAGLSAPLFIHAFTSGPSEPKIKHPPTIKEVLQAMAPQQQQKQQQPAAASE